MCFLVWQHEPRYKFIMKKTIKKHLGIRVKALREKARLTQEELSEICEVSWRTISNIERGTVIPDLKVLIAISEHFKITLDDLLKLPPLENKSTARLEQEMLLMEKIKSCDDKLLSYISDQVNVILKHFQH